MKSSVLSACGLLATMAAAAPLAKRQSSNIDATVLQFALTLEHLENVFYKKALTMFTEDMFTAAGYSATYYSNLKQIAYDEEQHVKLLTSALSAAGAMPVAACEYNFAFTDVTSFITLSSVIEGVGTSAYLGGAPLITSKDYLTVAGSILVTEALHTSYQRAWVGEVPFPSPYGTPLDPTAVYSIAAPFIKSCPSSNAALPFTPFPALAAATSSCSSGSTASFMTKASIPAGSFLTFISGLNVVSVAGTISGMDISAAVPSVAAGQTYVLVTSADVSGKFDDSKVLFGPAIIEVAPATPTIDFGYYKE